MGRPEIQPVRPAQTAQHSPPTHDKESSQLWGTMGKAAWSCLQSTSGLGALSNRNFGSEPARYSPATLSRDRLGKCTSPPPRCVWVSRKPQIRWSMISPRPTMLLPGVILPGWVLCSWLWKAGCAALLRVHPGPLSD